MIGIQSSYMYIFQQTPTTNAHSFIEHDSTHTNGIT